MLKFVFILFLEWAATVIQTQARGLIAKNKHCKHEKAIFILQGAMRAWSAVTLKSNHSCLTIPASTRCHAHGTSSLLIPRGLCFNFAPCYIFYIQFFSGSYKRYFIFIMERHRFVHMKKSATIIQQAVRIWIRGKKRLESNESVNRYELPEGKIPSRTSSIVPSPQEHCSADDKTIASATPCQHYEHVETLPASAAHSLCFDGMDSLGSNTSPLSMFESNCKSTASSELGEVDVISVSNISSQAHFVDESLVSTRTDLPVLKESVASQRIQSSYRNLTITAAIKIQSRWRCYSARNSFTKQVQAIVGIQTSIRLSLHHRARQLSAVQVQRFIRGWLARKRLLG